MIQQDESLYSTLSFQSPKTIVLVGLMGAGKTSIGKRLAQRLDLSFCDSDHAVEEAAGGRPIKEVLEVFGEEFFRHGEQRVIARLLDQPVHVLATGGGAFMSPLTRDLIKKRAISVWLKADLDTLVARVSRRNDRPLLEGENHREVLSKLIEERYPIYKKADVTVETFDEPTKKTVDRVIGKLADFIRQYYPNDYVLKSV